MPHTATDHNGFLKKICGCCTLKSGNIQKITESLLELIRRHHCPEYDPEIMPSVICKTFEVSLRSIDSEGDSATKNLPTIDYSVFVVPKNTRATASAPCQCQWCLIGRKNGKDYVKHQKEVKESRGRPRLDPSKPTQVEAIKVCTSCAGTIARGVAHHCNKTSRNENLGNLI